MLGADFPPQEVAVKEQVVEPATGPPSRASGASKKQPVRLGDMLVAAGLLTEQQVGEVIVYQKQHLVRFGTACVTLGFLKEADLESTL